ncbi:MAG: single-stranded DNA-binding protein [archaeon]|nr:single-stranded DNA-binding protein [archaeon]
MTDPSNMNFEPLVKELYAALDGKVSEETLQKELVKYLVTYKTGETIAKDSILKRYSGSRPSGTYVSGASVTKKIGELEGTELSVTVIGKMVFVDKSVKNIKGVEKTLISGILADDTGSASFTIWDGNGEYQKGAVYTFKNAYTKKWNDKIQINIGNRGKVEPNDEVVFDSVASSSSASFSTGGSATDVLIKDITEQSRSVNITGVLSGVSSRVIVVKGEEKTIYGGIIADHTGKIQFTDWNNHDLRDGETVVVKNAYIRAWKGIPQVNIGDNSTVTIAETKLNSVSTGPSSRTVEEVMKAGGGGLDLAITGVIVDVKNGSGLIKRCPQCNRSVLGEECSAHGRIEPVMDLRLKLTVDDGTGAISAIINRNDTELLTDITLDEAIELAREKGDMRHVTDRMTSTLILKKITVYGNIMSDDFGPQMSVRKTEVVSTDLTAEAGKLYDEVEESLS